MVTLITPDPARHDEWKAVFDEFGASPKDGTGFRAAERVDMSREGFAAYLADRARQGDVTVAPEEGMVHCTYFWVLDDDGALAGFLALRHALTAFLLDVGGHIGYSVRPGARGRGIAQAALRAGLREAARRGIAPVLVACSVDNAASRAVLEKCGGQFDGIRSSASLPDASRRYWFGDGERPTQPTA